jgi:phytoene dehydrogenase-like protein
MTPVIIIGAGHNGLVAAFYLSRAGHKSIVLERRDVVGGAAVTEEIAAGYRCPTLTHATGPLRPSIVRDMQLARRVDFLQPNPRLVALDPDGRALTFSDRARTTEAIRGFSQADAARYPEFCDVLDRLGAFLAPILESTPPSLDGPGTGELWDLLKIGKRFRGLGRADGYRLLRWLPMAVADLVSEYFTTEVLQAAVAARAIAGTFTGPWSAGTGAVLLLNAAVDPAPGGSSITVKGGPGALTHAMAEAAREAGAEIKLESPVAQILVKSARVTGVRLADGSELAARAVISSADPKHTFLSLIDPVELTPGFLSRIRNYRVRGSVAKVNLALNGLPTFRGVANPADLHGRIHIGPTTDYLEKAFDAAKYGDIAEQPWLDVTIPSLEDGTLAPPGRHVMSVYVQSAPYMRAQGTAWAAERDRLATVTINTLEQYAPGILQMIEHRHVVTPLDLERKYGLTCGDIFHGEPALDQLFTMRPVLGWAQYRTPIDGLFMCGAGTHPGGGFTGGPGQNASREIAKLLKERTRS